VLAGLVERLTYHNAENGFCVAKQQGKLASFCQFALLFRNLNVIRHSPSAR
jgi:hypothetical protein